MREKQFVECKVHGRLEFSDCYYNKFNDNYRCKQCDHERVKKWARENPDRNRAIKKLDQQEYMQTERGRDVRKRRENRLREQLSDGYVRKMISKKGFPTELITNEMVEIKRAILQICRMKRNGDK